MSATMSAMREEMEGILGAEKLAYLTAPYVPPQRQAPMRPTNSFPAATMFPSNSAAKGSKTPTKAAGAPKAPSIKVPGGASSGLSPVASPTATSTPRVGKVI